MIADKFAERAPQRRTVAMVMLGLAAALAAVCYMGGNAATELVYPANAQCWNKKFVLTQDVVGAANKYKGFWRFTGQNNFINRAPTATNDEFMLHPLPNGQVQMTRFAYGNPMATSPKPILAQQGEFHFKCLSHCNMFWMGQTFSDLLYNPQSESFVMNFSTQGHFVIFGRFA